MKVVARDGTKMRVHTRVRLGMGHSHQLIRPFKAMTLHAEFAGKPAPTKYFFIEARDCRSDLGREHSRA